MVFPLRMTSAAGTQHCNGFSTPCHEHTNLLAAFIGLRNVVRYQG